ncbi:alpha/beta hydrolase [Pseudonocardia nigra]|uniref:alpha/beta hydrolase n=1 Tax=Pseudonocardia nigra TaxID=1921578 RepID=UPI001C5E7333|nr:alpha/beta hydrolase [Pseudonocardia nigra]
MSGTRVDAGAVERDGVTRIVLVHGAWHDASSWAPLVRELRSRGHDVVAVDLPSEQPGLGAEHYAEAVEAALAPIGPSDRFVLVGHSLGGLTVPVVAQRLGAERVAALVLVAALVPRPGMSSDDQMRAEPGIMAPGFGRGQQRNDDGTTWWPAEAAVSGLYAGVSAEASDEVVAAAVSRLRPRRGRSAESSHRSRPGPTCPRSSSCAPRTGSSARSGCGAWRGSCRVRGWWNCRAGTSRCSRDRTSWRRSSSRPQQPRRWGRSSGTGTAMGRRSAPTVLCDPLSMAAGHCRTSGSGRISPGRRSG